VCRQAKVSVYKNTKKKQCIHSSSDGRRVAALFKTHSAVFVSGYFTFSLIFFSLRSSFVFGEPNYSPRSYYVYAADKCAPGRVRRRNTVFVWPDLLVAHAPQILIYCIWIRFYNAIAIGDVFGFYKSARLAIKMTIFRLVFDRKNFLKLATQ